MKCIHTPAGKRFGDWITLADSYRKNKMSFVSCRCICGTEKHIHVGNLRQGKTLGCGCKHGERISQSKTRHGLSDGPEHICWQRIRQRCNNPANPDFKNYGRRGIRVCIRWESFDNFIADMGLRPGAGYTIERLNNDGPYSPWNCKWATRSEQNNNKRNNVRVMHNGEMKTIAQLSRETGIPAATLRSRYHQGLRLIH